MATPYHPRHHRSRSAYGPLSPLLRSFLGLTGSPTGPDLLFLALSCLTVLAALAVAGGLAAHPFG